MRTLLLISFVFLIHCLTEAQEVCNGLYINEKSNEFININNGTIQFRLDNKDAFGSFIIGYGSYEYKDKNKYCIYENWEIEEQTSVINKYLRNDSLITLKVLYKDHSPIMSAYLYLKNGNNRKNDFVGITDSAGTIVFSEDQVFELIDKQLSLQIIALGFSTKGRIVLEHGYDYIVYSSMPEKFPFVVFRTGNISINRLSAKEIEVGILSKVRKRNRGSLSKLKKVASKQQFEYLLDKDVTDIQ